MGDCTDTPNPGYDNTLKQVCFASQGTLEAGDPDPHFSVQFRARID